MTEERKAFEAWAISRAYSLNKNVVFGNYLDGNVEFAWKVWQARGAQTAEPVAWITDADEPRMALNEAKQMLIDQGLTHLAEPFCIPLYTSPQPKEPTPEMVTAPREPTPEIGLTKIEAMHAQGFHQANAEDALAIYKSMISVKDTLKSCADELDRLTTELAAAKAERDALRRDAERWKYWKPRMIAADFEWGQFKEPVLVFSLNCKVSADIDKSTDEAIAATGSNHVD